MEIRMREGKVVVVDDNEAVLKTLRIILAREFRIVLAVSTPSLLPALLKNGDVDIVLLDMNFGVGKQSGHEGLFWLNYIQQRDNPPAVILITAYADINLAVSSLKKGATDFIVKPWDNEKLISTLSAAWNSRLKESAGNQTLDEMEKQFIQEVLKEKKGNLTLVAQQLAISRQTLYNKMKKYDL